MAENTAIEWTDHTFNPWWGCTKVSPGCTHCYADALDRRTGGAHWGPKADRRRTKPANWNQPRKWNRQAQQQGRRFRVFCASMADVFDDHPSILPEWREDLWRLIEETRHLDWLLLTKRPQDIMRMIPKRWRAGFPANVWVGTSVVNQPEADANIRHLLAVPAAVRFLSCEPLLGEIDLLPWLDPTGACCGGEPEYRCQNCPSDAEWRYTGPYGDDPGIDWVIAGGESGPGARPMHPDWARSLRDQCVAAGVPFLFKQWGEWAPNVGAVDWADIDDDPEASRFWHREWNGDSWGEPFKPLWCDFGDGNYDQEQCVSRIGKKAAGRMLDGRAHDEFPEVPRDHP